MGATVTLDSSTVTIGGTVRTSQGATTSLPIRLTIDAGTYTGGSTLTETSSTSVASSVYRVAVVVPASNTNFSAVTSRIGLQFRISITDNRYRYIPNSFSMAVNSCPDCTSTSLITGSGGTTWNGTSTGVQSYYISIPSNAITISGMAYSGPAVVYQSAARITDSATFKNETGSSI